MNQKQIINQKKEYNASDFMLNSLPRFFYLLGANYFLFFTPSSSPKGGEVKKQSVVSAVGLKKTRGTAKPVCKKDF